MYLVKCISIDPSLTPAPLGYFCSLGQHFFPGAPIPPSDPWQNPLTMIYNCVLIHNEIEYRQPLANHNNMLWWTVITIASQEPGKMVVVRLSTGWL